MSKMLDGIKDVRCRMSDEFLMFFKVVVGGMSVGCQMSSV